jgi:hypothetical protein
LFVGGTCLVYPLVMEIKASCGVAIALHSNEEIWSMDKQKKQQAILQRLHSLADQPGEQARYALELLDQERGNQVVSAALDIVTAAATPEARPILLRLYDYYDAAGVKRDAGGYLRSAILGALLPIADPADWTLAEHATKTYEFLPPGREENAGTLRAAGLVLLSRLDPVLASYHCTRLLNDPHTSRMSGEPAVSAARLLANQAHFLPLYAYVHSNREGVAEVEAECLKLLAKVPASVVDSLFAYYNVPVPAGGGQFMPYYETKEDVVLGGLFDLLLEHMTRGAYLDFTRTFLRTTQRYDVYRYVVSMIVANHQLEAWALLVEVARREQNQHKVGILLSALALVRHDPAITELTREL